MLIELRIKDFAIIDELALEFAPGFVVFTGETGAGKSIIIDAVSLLLGGRADAEVIRSGTDAARVEGVFALDGAVRADAVALLEREGLLEDESTVTLAREIRREGRNLCRLNGRAVSLGLLKEIGQYLVDVHGQSEHLSLLRVREHVHLLDRYADAESLRAEVARQVSELAAIRRELDELRRGERDAARRTDMLNFQIEEIAAARLTPGEDAALLEERTRLANAEQLASLAEEALAALDEGVEGRFSASDLLGQAAHALAGLARIDASQAEARDNVRLLAEQLADLVRDRVTYRDSIEFNPKRLDAVEERLELIRLLKRKYGDTIEAVLEFAAHARGELEAITHSGERIGALAEQETRLLRRIGQRGAELSAARREAAARLSQAIEAELADLRMERARFGVSIVWEADPHGAVVDALPDDGPAAREDERVLFRAPTFDSRPPTVAFDSTGLDRVEFLVEPNPGEGLKPLARVASGGESSRLMLALKSVLARADRTPTLIFDEIDQGIGGRVGAVVGQKLWGLSDSHQVLCITHLPQLAAYGDQHLKVEKTRETERTVTRARPLAEPERVTELALMLGAMTEKTRDSAEEILETVRRDKAAARVAA